MNENLLKEVYDRCDFEGLRAIKAIPILLSRYDIKDIRQLSDLSIKQMMKYRGVGKATATDIYNRLQLIKCPDKCCCNCSNHHLLYSHPSVDKKPIDNIAGYVCCTSELGVVLCNKHGECEHWKC